jgi:Yip1 domain
MSLKYLITILYRPRETMRRILDSSGSRWGLQIAALASICASVKDADVSRVEPSLPGLKLMPLMSIVALGMIAQAIAWIVFVFFVAAIALPVGRFLGGKARFMDIVTALGWALVPAIWSVLYRVPFVLLVAPTFQVHEKANPRDVLLNFFSHGGCSVVVIYLFCTIAFELWCVILASFTVAEAQGFSTQKGFVNVVAAIVLPIVVTLAAAFSFR